MPKRRKYSPKVKDREVVPVKSRRNTGSFKSGQSGNPNGRPKGTPNKLSGDVKAMILAALDKAGGAEYLLRQSVDNPGAFLTLIGKVLPTTLAGDPTAPLQSRLIVTFVAPKAIAPPR